MRSPFQSVVYLQIKRRWLGVRVLTWSGGDFQWEGIPEVFVAHDKKGRRVAIGIETARQNPGLTGHHFTAFAHPRTPIDGFEDTALVIRQCIREAGYKGRGKLLYVVHLLDHWEGGLSDVERRAIGQLCMAECGARNFHVIEQPFVLSPPQVLEIARSRTGVLS